MRKLAIVLVPLSILALVIGGCGGGSEALSPEAKEISDFLNGKHVNAVLWEEWNLFDEYGCAVSLYGDNGPEGFTKLWNFRQAWTPRIISNYNDIVVISPPESLSGFWGKITEMMGDVCKILDPGAPGPFRNWVLEEYVPRKQAEVWLELSGICRQHNIAMPWPLPRVAP